ncbi:MAG: Tat pathway signal protein [Eggerthellaceae bacterium]
MPTRRRSNIPGKRSVSAQRRRAARKNAEVGKTFGRSDAKPRNPKTKVDTSFMKESPKFAVDGEGMHIPTGNSEVVLTRRQLLIGAGVVAGVAALGVGASAYRQSNEDASSFETLTVSTDQVTTLDDFTQVKSGKAARLEGSYRLPYGTLLWCNGTAQAVCLLPTSKAKPLVKIGLLALSSGTVTTVVSKAKGQSEGFEIYDARTSDTGLIWTEENILTGAWRIYTAQIGNGGLEKATKVDEGDSSTQTPTIAATGERAYWQILPASSDEDSGDEGTSLVRTTTFSNPSNVQTIYTYQGTLACDLAVGEGGVVIVPAHEGTSSYLQLTLIDEGGTVLDALTLPVSMTPQNVGYGPTGFTFTFADIYDYGDGISQLGTYAPTEKPGNGDYSQVSWFRFGRTPMQSAAWCGDRLMVKSSSTVAGIDLANKQYFTFSLKSGAEDYGDCLASEGSHDRIVTFQNVDNTEAQETGATSSTGTAKYCLARVWSMKN